MLRTWFSDAHNSVKSKPKLRHFTVMAISMPNFSPQASATHTAELFKRRQQKVFMEGKNSFSLSSYSHMDEMFSLKLSKKFTFEQRPRALFEQFKNSINKYFNNIKRHCSITNLTVGNSPDIHSIVMGPESTPVLMQN